MGLIAGAVVLVLVAVVLGRIHLEENFDDDSWKDRWVTSTYNGTEVGKFVRTTATYSSVPNNNGLSLVYSRKEVALSTRFTPFNITNKTLVLQVSVKKQDRYFSWHGHFGLYDCNFKPADMDEDTPYLLMFGLLPRYQFIFVVDSLKGERSESKINVKDDEYMHVYTMTIEPDMRYQLHIDGEKMTNGIIPRGNKTTGSQNDSVRFPLVCGIGLLFYQDSSQMVTLDNLLLSDDVQVAERKREEILKDMGQLEWLRTPWLVDIAPEDLTRIFSSGQNFKFNDNNQTNFFLVDFDKFLVSFNWSGENSVIKAAAEYNKYHGMSNNESIQLWVSFQPQQIDILDDLESVLEIVNEANSMAAGTVTAIVINYGFLELDEQTLPFVNHEVQRVKTKLKSLPVPAPKLALQISDINCQSTQSIRYLEAYLFEFLLLMPMQPGNEYSATNEFDRDKAAFLCSQSAEPIDDEILPVLHTHTSIEIDFEKGIYNYKKELATNILTDSRLKMIHAADRMGSVETVQTKQGPLGRLLLNWLYQPPRFSKLHFGAVFSWNDSDLLGPEYFVDAIFENFMHIAIHVSVSDSGNGEWLETIVQEIANYSLLMEELGSKEDHSFRSSEDDAQIQISILITIDTTDLEVIKRQGNKIISAVQKANQIFPDIINEVFFDWTACSRSEICSGIKKNASEDICGKLEIHYETLVNIVYTIDASDSTESSEPSEDLIMGPVFDKQFWDDHLESLRKGCEGAREMILNNYYVLCKTTVRHEDIVKYGGLQAYKMAIEDLSICTMYKEDEDEELRRIYFYVNVIGCVGGHSNMTSLVEYVKLMENLNGWAVREGAFLFIDAGAEVPSKCSENMGIAGEVGCSCGWWIKQEYNGKYQDKKMVARQLYEKAKADEEKSKTEVPTTESLLWLWVLITVIVFGVLFLIPATFIAFHYRSKYILTKHEVDDFIKGRQASRAEPSAGGEEAAETQSYNSEKYELSPSSFTIDITSKCLGSGEFGKVYPGSVRRGDEIIETAVKITNNNLIGKSHGYYMALKGLLSEIKILAYVGEHNHIVALLGAYTKKVRKGEIAVFLELCHLGSLDKYLHSIKPQIMVDDHVSSDIGTFDPDAYSLDEEENERENVQVLDKQSSDELFRWAGEIASGMEFLASKKLVHADLATRNVLLTANKVAKISDFGLSRRLYDYTEYVKQSQAPLPWRWMAPESLCRSIFNEKTDIWAFGVTLWEMFTLGDQPYPGLTWSDKFPALLDRGLRLPEPRFNLKQIYSVMLQCWEINPALRPTFAQLKCELNEI